MILTYTDRLIGRRIHNDNRHTRCSAQAPDAMRRSGLGKGLCMTPRRFTGAALIFIVALVSCSQRPSEEQRLVAAEPSFWPMWGDGQAEVNGYDLDYPRYGAMRKGNAIAIFVTEPFSAERFVKREAPDGGQNVMKLNLLKAFPAGAYDYRLMTSTFVSLPGAGSVRIGRPLKVAFSSQEWCGQMYHQLTFPSAHAHSTRHSYFENEAHEDRSVSLPADAFLEDTALLWARGFALPVLRPGESRNVTGLRALERLRLDHLPTEPLELTISRGDTTMELITPAGRFVVERSTIREAGGRTLTIFTDVDPGRRIIGWETDSGERALLRKSLRLRYWDMKDPKFVSVMQELGWMSAEPPSSRDHDGDQG